MNSVQSLIAEPFCIRSTLDKTEIKSLGRPTPDLTIKQSISSKARTFTRTFSPDIYNKHTWICGCDVKNALFCFPCLLFGGEESWTKIGFTDLNHLGERIKKHALSAKHMKNVAQLSFFGTEDVAAHRRSIQLHNEKVRHNRHILNVIIDCVRFCGAFELALRENDESTSGVFHELINFSAELDVALKEHLEKTSVFKETSHLIQNEILQTMFSVCQEEITKEIEESDYLSVIVDETSDVSNTYQMAIVFRYIAKGKPVERFWDFLTPPAHDAQTLAAAILTELEKHVKDDKSKLIAQTYDGAYVMGGVQAIVKQTYEHAAYIHYYAHQVNLIMLNAASINMDVRIFVSNLQGIGAFFSTSPERIVMLGEMVKKRLPWLDTIKIWDFNSKIVWTVFQYREDMVETMRNIVNGSKNASTTIISQASRYIKILTSESFVSWLNLFYKIMPHVDVLFAKFKSGQIDNDIADKSISSFETQLTRIRNSITEFPGTDEPSGIKRHKTDRTREAKEACDIIIAQAKDRFSFTGHLNAANLFFSEKYRQYSGCFPDGNFVETIKAYPFFDGHKLQLELSVIYETEALRSTSGVLPLYYLISQNGELSETFKETLKLLKMLITIPMALAEVERWFPTLKKIKTFLKNTVSQEGLSALAMLSQERDLIESIPDFNQRVIDKFAASEERRGDFLFQ